jgi:predicted TIM-barrel fold metal-dependent hydrolase
MVIDFHVHLTTLKGMERLFQANGKDPLSKIQKDRFINLAQAREAKTSKETWTQVMEKYGIDRVVLNACDALNEEVLSYVIQDSDHFCGLYYGDPSSPVTLEEMSRYVRAGKLNGIGEISPTWEHYSLTDERIFPFYEMVQDREVPILWHFGVGFFPFGDLRFSKPAELESIVRLFPKIPHVVAHLGEEHAEYFLSMSCWLKEWFGLPIYFDLASIRDLPKYFLKKFSLAELIGRFVEILGPEQILWATDAGLPYENSPFESDAFRSLDSLKLGGREMDLILGGNAARLLKLSA